MPDIGEKIRQLRMKNELTQLELAQKVSVSESMICRIERGSVVPSVRLVRDIAAVLGCKTSEIID